MAETTPIVLVATGRARPGKEREYRQLFEKVVPWGLAEPGCLQFSLHEDIDDPSRLLVYEIWQSREFLDQHRSNKEFVEVMSAFDDLLAERMTVFLMNKLL